MDEASLYRFLVPGFADAAGSAGPRIELPPTEGHHAHHVLRLEPEQEIVLFDGAGHWARAKLAAINKNSAAAVLLGPPQMDPPPAICLTLATAMPKGDRAQWLIEQASQLNAACVQWLTTDRGVAGMRGGEYAEKQEKWNRWSAEAAKQCGRNRLLEIRPPGSLTGIMQKGIAENASPILWLDAHPGGKPPGKSLTRSGMAPQNCTALIGPEGGWSDAERELLEDAEKRGELQRVRLMDTVLRIETACAAIAAIIMSARAGD